MSADRRLADLAVRSHNEDTILVEMVYCKKYVQFDIPFMQAKYLPVEDIVRRYFEKAFAAIDVPLADLGETHPSVVSSSVVTTG